MNTTSRSSIPVPGARHSAAHSAGIALIALLLAACGGGGGGGSSGASGGTGSTGGATTGGLGGGLATCPATTGTSASGLTLGVCQGTTYDIAFVDVSSPVAVNDYAAKTYTLNVPASIGSPVLLSAAAQEDRCRNVLGDRSGLTLQSPLPAASGQPRSTLLSFTQPTTGTGATDALCPNRVGQPAELPLQAIDFGTWERYTGGLELYYGTWFTPRAGAATRPTANVQFLGAGLSAPARTPRGVSVGYLFTALSAYGLSGQLLGTTFDAASSTLQGTISTFAYSSTASTQQTSTNVSISSIAFTATVAPDGTFSGTLTGSGAIAPSGGASVPAQVSGIVTGVIVNGPGGYELAGRYQAGLTPSVGTTVTARAVGSFAAAQ